MAEPDIAEPPAAPEVHHVRRAVELPKALAAAAVLAITSWVALDGVPEWEADVFEALNGLSGWLVPVLWAPMQLGSLFGPVLVAIVSWIVWRRWRPSVGALVVGLVAWQLAKVVKDGVQRGRPIDLMPEYVSRWGTPTDGLGFVSGHSTVAFALATVLSPYLRRPWRWAAYGVAGSVALSRIHLAAHFPLDTVGGAALGCLLGWLYHLAVGVPDDVPGITERWSSTDR
jgi:membrane-associated phospholipid phosphatase